MRVIDWLVDSLDVLSVIDRALKTPQIGPNLIEFPTSFKLCEVDSLDCLRVSDRIPQEQPHSYESSQFHGQFAVCTGLSQLYTARLLI